LLYEAHPAALLILDGDDGEDGRLPLHLALGAPARGRGRGTEDKEDKEFDYDEEEEAVPRLILEAGPSAAATADWSRGGRYPLHVAIQGRWSAGLIQAILAAYPDAATELVRNSGGTTTALHMLADVRDQYDAEEVADIASAILEVRPDAAKVQDGRGRLPLHAACVSSSANSKGGRNDTKQAKKKKKKKKKSSTPTLVQMLLDAHADGVGAKDSEGNLPLHLAVAAFDASAALALLELDSDGAKDNDRPPLHIACGSLLTAYDPYSGKEDAVDRILSRLLDIYPEAAAMSDEDGRFPLSILLDRPNVLERVQPATFQALLDANPEAASHRVGDSGDYPLQKAINYMRNSKDPSRSLAMMELLLGGHPDIIKNANDRGTVVFQQVLTQAQGTATQMEANNALGALARRIFDLYPDAASLRDSSGNHPLHSLARIMGQTAGSSKRVAAWAALFRDVLDADSSPADMPDRKGRPPLHVLCFHLGDAAYDGEDGDKYERAADFDTAVRALIAKSSNVLRLEDDDGQTPLDLLSRELKGRSSAKLSQTLNFVKEEIRQARKSVPRRASSDETTAESSATANDEL